MASKLTLPPQASKISFGDPPRRSCLKICHTMMRVPVNVGLPWQIPESATM
jgi:hypothetical protein